MARTAKFDHEQIIVATSRLAASDGPGQATMARIAGAIRAPTGSLYHRFASRDVLLGEVWLRAAESFQAGFIALLKGPSAWDCGLAAILYVPRRVREEPEEARILMLHRREDFLESGWPVEMQARAAALKRQADGALRDFSRRALGSADGEALRTVAYVLVDAPLAALLPHIRARQTPPASVEALLQATYVAVMAQAGARPGKRKDKDGQK